MGRHLTAAELDNVHALKSQGLMPLDMHSRLTCARSAKGESGPSLRAVRRALKGASYKRAKVEARGRKPTLTAANVRALDRARKRLIAKANGDYA